MRKFFVLLLKFLCCFSTIVKKSSTIANNLGRIPIGIINNSLLIFYCFLLANKKSSTILYSFEKKDNKVKKMIRDD